MDRDAIERDRLLTRLDANVEFLVSSQKSTTDALVDHAKVDDKRFNTIDETLKEIRVKDAAFFGKIYGGSAVITAIVAFLIKVIFK